MLLHKMKDRWKGPLDRFRNGITELDVELEGIQLMFTQCIMTWYSEGALGEQLDCIVVN